MRFNAIGRGLVRVLAVAMLMASAPFGAAQAGMVSTDRVVDQLSVRQDRVRVMEFLGRDDVRQQLEALGVDAEEATARAESLSDLEIAQIAGQMDQLPAGQDAASAIIGAAVAIFIVLIITDVLGVTNVFPFVSAIQ